MQTVLAAKVIQAIKAKALNDTNVLFDVLPLDEQLSAVSHVARAMDAIAAGSIKGPEDLHNYHCARLTNDGWRHGAVYRPLKSQTPLLRPFHAIPADVRELVTSCFDVLKAAVHGELEFAGRNAPTGNFDDNNPYGVSQQ